MKKIFNIISLILIFSFSINYNIVYALEELNDDTKQEENVYEKNKETTIEDKEKDNNKDNNKYVEPDSIANSSSQEKIDISYRTHVQTYGWLNWVKNGEATGTVGESKRIEAIEIDLSQKEQGDVEYISYIQSYGWDSEWKKNGNASGTEGLKKRIEAIKIRLTGSISEKYDIYYRVHVQTYGWLDWAKNGETAGTVGFGKRLEAIEIKLVDKNELINQSNSYIQKDDYLTYSAHVQSIGWQKSVTHGPIGTEGQGKRLEAYNVSFEFAKYSGQLFYQSFIEGSGWEKTWKNNGESSGTTGKSKKIEQIRMKLMGEVSEYYDVYYRVHVQGFGWLGWAKNGEAAGTEDIGFRIEAMEVKIVSKGQGEETGHSLEKKGASLSYSGHIRRYGDLTSVNEGQTIGTTGQGLRMEAISINIDTEISGNILYKTYIDNVGWEESWKMNGELSGTTGQGRGIQLIRIQLDGDLEKKYDVYYRIHTESFGWLGWARNGEVSGADCYDIQAVQVRLFLKIDNSQNNLDRSRIHTETGFYKENGYTYYKDKNGVQATDWIHIMDKKYFFNSLGIMIGKNVKKVMDVSAWQGDIDWDTVYQYGDIDGVILRIAAGCEYEDKKLARNVEALKRLNIPYGIYIYSYAETYNEGRIYADFTINTIKKYNLNPRIGIFLDLESNKYTSYLTTQHYEQLTQGFMEKMYNAGYGNLTRIYTYKSLAEEKLNSPYLYNQITWIAQYNHFNRYVNENVVGWQYSSQEYVPGVPTLADMSVWFIDF